MMRIVVSPYHLSTREIPAMASLLLADECITLLPMGRGGKSAARDIAEQSESYRELVRSWGWADELWRAGVIRGEIDGESAVSDVQRAAAAIADDPALVDLRGLMHDRLFEDDRAYLNALAYDIMKSGPDPGISLPVAAGLDAFAARHGAVSARSHWKSVAQTAESELISDRVSFVIPALVQADASRLIKTRDVLGNALNQLRTAIDECAAALTPSRVDDLKVAAMDYGIAFERSMTIISKDCKSDDVRMITGDIAMTLCTLPHDAVMRSSVRAMQAMSGGGRSRRNDPALALTSGGPVSALYFKTLGGGR